MVYYGLSNDQTCMFTIFSEKIYPMLFYTVPLFLWIFLDFFFLPCAVFQNYSVLTTYGHFEVWTGPNFNWLKSCRVFFATFAKLHFGVFFISIITFETMKGLDLFSTSKWLSESQKGILGKKRLEIVGHNTDFYQWQ